MRNFALMLAAVSLAVPVAITVPTDQAQAKKHRYYSRSYRNDCHRSKGTTGTIAGGAGGAGIAAVAGASPLGVIASGVGGAVVGRVLDQRHDRAEIAAEAAEATRSQRPVHSDPFNRRRGASPRRRDRPTPTGSPPVRPS